MKNIFRVFCFAMLLLSFSAAARQPAEVISSLDRSSRSELGVPLRALGFLAEATPGDYLLKAALVQKGTWPLIQALEKAGYVVTRSVGSGSEEYVEIIPTPAGCVIQDALHGR